jgi:hypothetical protein
MDSNGILKEILSPALFPNHLERIDDSSRWITGNELIARWRIMGFELFDFMKQELQAYTSHGKKIVDSDSLERDHRKTPNQIEAEIRSTIPTYRVFGTSGPQDPDYDLKILPFSSFS